jgi:hypothetical protein
MTDHFSERSMMDPLVTFARREKNLLGGISNKE